MIKPERGEDDVPDDEKAKEKGKVLNLDPYGEELAKGDMTDLVIDCPSGQGKGAGHNQEIKQLERFVENLTAKRNHGKNLLNLIPERAPRIQVTQ
jgi:hypothetical protein